MLQGYNSFLGYTPMGQGTPLEVPPVITTHTGLKIFGSCIIDNIHVINQTLTNQQILDIDYTQTPTWVSGVSLFLATFDYENLNAGNVLGITDPITGWIVLRKEVGQSKYEQLTVINNASIIEFLDKFAYSRANFEYAIIPIAGDTLGEPIIIPSFVADLTSWYLMSEDATVIYKMCANVNTTSNISNEDVSQKQTAGQFDVFNRGNRDFISSSISFIPTFGYESDGYTITQTQQQMRELELFIKNGLPKILKTPKGNIWKVYTTNPSFTPVVMNNRVQLNYIDFDFAQISEL